MVILKRNPVFSIVFQTLGCGGRFVYLECVIIRGEERQEGEWAHNALGLGRWDGGGRSPAKESRTGALHTELHSLPHSTLTETAHKSTFITLNDSSWAQGKHLFQSLSRSRMTIFMHQPQSREPAQPDRTLLCDGLWRDVISAHATQPAAPTNTAHVHPAAKQTQREIPLQVGRAFSPPETRVKLENTSCILL